MMPRMRNQIPSYNLVDIYYIKKEKLQNLKGLSIQPLLISKSELHVSPMLTLSDPHPVMMPMTHEIVKSTLKMKYGK
jgi:hypothetical protein